MTAPDPILYFDLASPYAYLAVARARSVLGERVRLEPVLVGAIFGWRGRGSWALTGARAENVAEIERRAARYGLPPLCWPAGWPANSLRPMRCAVWADRAGRLEPFASAVYRRQFAQGGDITSDALLAESAAEAGLDPDATLGASGDPDIKAELKARTEGAWTAGVRGVPTTLVGETILFGDDRLEQAAGPHTTK